MADWGSESGHYYHRNGDPCYTVVGANGRERPTTVRDARKMNLVPSVTTIIGCAAKPGLEAWKSTQLLLAGLTLPRHPEEGEAPWLERVRNDARMQAAKAADLGTAIHGAIESHFRGAGLSFEQLAYSEHVSGVLAALGSFCGSQEWMAEKSFAKNGYGGKVDLHSQEWVLDYKSKEFGPEDNPELRDEHPMQLAAYADGLPANDGISIYRHQGTRMGIVWVSTSVPGLVSITEIPWEEVHRGWQMFQALKDYWWAKHETQEYHRERRQD